MKIKAITAAALTATLVFSPQVFASKYLIDTKGAHAFIQFRIKHLGYSWLSGRFNRFSGEFEYDKRNPETASVNIEVDTASIDSNHAERDKHLRSEKFLHVKKFPKAYFKSTSFKEHDNGTATLEGLLTLHGVTRPIVIAVDHIGHGTDPWGGYRRGFEGKTRIALWDYGITYNLGPESKELELILSIEGINQSDTTWGQSQESWN